MPPGADNELSGPACLRPVACNCTDASCARILRMHSCVQRTSGHCVRLPRRGQGLPAVATLVRCYMRALRAYASCRHGDLSPHCCTGHTTPTSWLGGVRPVACSSVYHASGYRRSARCLRTMHVVPSLRVVRVQSGHFPPACVHSWQSPLRVRCKHLGWTLSIPLCARTAHYCIARSGQTDPVLANARAMPGGHTARGHGRLGPTRSHPDRVAQLH